MLFIAFAHVFDRILAHAVEEPVITGHRFEVLVQQGIGKSNVAVLLSHHVLEFRSA
jgi:hypothetical protein